MRTELKRLLWGAAALAMAVTCILGAKWLLGLADTSARADVTYYATENTPDFDALDALREAIGDAPGSVTAYAQKTDVAISTKDGIGTSKVDALWMDGFTGLALDARVLYGSLPVLHQQSDCALDADTARSLFGSADIVGQRVVVGEVELTVCAVFELPRGRFLDWGANPGRGIALCPAALAPKDTKIDALAFSAPPSGEKSSQELCKAWMDEAGITTPGRKVMRADRHALYGLWGQAFALLTAGWTAWVLARVAAIWGAGAVRCWWRARADPLRTAREGQRALFWGLLGCAVALGGAVAAMTLPKLTLDVPPSYLPTRWSDLGFWSSLLKKTSQAAAQRAMEGTLRPALVTQALLRWIPWLGAAALALLCAALHRIWSPVLKAIRMRNGKHLNIKQEGTP